ncbi:methyl-accepting chemotaxis protein [Vreelandella massiliensis]|uniref:methyl-accepting chemotaxis protein n=1 Tax=Vreelandella massiliensis TaxID=1816686 RepID=UPI00096A7EA2|nr:methyl-accepting chemotaxis protein [Halomonas massiliensis]
MKNYLNRTPMRAKFALVLALPLLALAWFAINGVLERQAAVRELDRLYAMTELAQSAGDWVHQIQLERGMTAGFLGSEGESFSEQLIQQRRNVDDAAAAFREQRDALAEGVLSEAARDDLTQLNRQWERTGRIRGDVDNLDIATREVLGHYTGINQQLMTLVGELSQLTREGEISRQLAAYFNLLEAKDLAGIERAMLANAFAADGMTPQALRNFLSLLGEEKAFLTAFRALSRPEVRDALDQALSGPEIERLIERRELAISQYDTGGYNVDPEQWFEWQTVKIGRLKALEDNVAENVITTTAALRSEARQALWVYLAVAILSSAVAVIVAVLMVRTITGPLKRALNSIATRGNDLTQRLEVPGTDELSKLYRAFNDASADTERLAAEVKRNAQSVEVASGEIAQGNQDLAQRTEEQSASLVQTASSMEEITATVRQTADNAHQAQRMTNDVAHEAQDAASVASRAQQAMQQIHEANDQVTTIIAAIDNIAFQTNLLALNASVEAARAGEHGRGFAVVADEVRKLASRSAQEADQIRKLIDNNVAKISEGESLVNSTSDTLETISQRVQKVAGLVDEMASATTEQSSGIEEINRAMTQLEEVTQQNAALVEQVAAASRSLDEQAEDMAEMIGKYKVGEVSGQPRLGAS